MRHVAFVIVTSLHYPNFQVVGDLDHGVRFHMAILLLLHLLRHLMDQSEQSTKLNALL